MVHTTGGSEKTDGGKRPRARSGGGRGQGQSLWIDLCVPSFPLPRPLAVFFFLYSLESGLEISRISPSLARGAMCEDTVCERVLRGPRARRGSGWCREYKTSIYAVVIFIYLLRGLVEIVPRYISHYFRACVSVTLRHI